MNKIFTLSLVTLSLMSGMAQAAPVLRSQIMVTTPIVTVGDMFDGADLYAEEPLFRAPAPGTAGQVSLESVRVAAAKIGLTDYQPPSARTVTVARFGQTVDTTQIEALIEASLDQQGYLSDGVSVDFSLAAPLPLLTADNAADPAQLVSLRYVPSSGAFAARFMISGSSQPVDVNGRAELVVPVPHLVTALNADAIIHPEDVEMRTVPVRSADIGSFSSLDQVIGMQLKRPARAGKLLNPNDLKTPALIARNEAVTIIFRSGLMTLTVKGQALGEAARGEPVQVLNLLSSKVLSATAVDPGTVIVADPAAATTIR